MTAAAAKRTAETVSALWFFPEQKAQEKSVTMRMEKLRCLIQPAHDHNRIMKYITKDNQKEIDYNSYLEYLIFNKSIFDSKIYTFASNYLYFDLSSPSSLHDSWLESFRVVENRIEGKDDSSIEVEIILLGAFHDRKIHMRYGDVSRYEFGFAETTIGKSCIRSRHGDIFTHEIRLENKVYEHEIAFNNGAKFLVAFSKFSHWEESL